MARKQLNLAQKIARITKAAKVVELGGVSADGGYAFSRIGDVLDAIEGLLDRHHLILTGSAVVEFQPINNLVFPGVSRSGNLSGVLIAWTLEDIDSGEKGTWYIPGEGDGDKGTYKALTGSRKYAHVFIFNLRAGDEPEQGSTVSREDAIEKAQKLGEEKAAKLAARKIEKEKVIVSWPEEHNGHKALFKGKTVIMEKKLFAFMGTMGNWSERNCGWLVESGYVESVVTDLRNGGCEVVYFSVLKNRPATPEETAKLRDLVEGRE